jgi:autophagy-related protein 101
VQVDDPEVESVVESRLDALLSWLANRSSASVSEVAVRLSFYELRTKQTWFGGASEERLYWEQWRVPLRVHRAPGAVASSLKGAVERSVFYILRAVNDKKEHIPPVSATSSGAVSHPFEIGLPGDAGTTGVALKRLVTSARPPLHVL